MPSCAALFRKHAVVPAMPIRQNHLRNIVSGPLAAEFVRYFFAGLVALGVDFTLYVALTELAGWHYLVSASVGFCAGLGMIYVLSILWIFRARRLARKSHEFFFFAVIGVLGLGLTYAVLYSLTEFLGIDYRVSKVFAAGAIFVFNFGCRKYYLFRAGPSGPAAR